MPQDSARQKSPFFSKAYGGYSREQEEYYRSLIGSPSKKVILDPMAGQGFAIAKLAFEGAHVWLGDLNPSLVLLTMLRDPRVIRQRNELSAWIISLLKPLKPKSQEEKYLDYVEDWVSPAIKEELRYYLKLIGIGSLNSPFLYSGGFWTAPLEARFAVCLPILAAREITCYRTSDNQTWLKKGGLSRETKLYAPLIRALEHWCSYAETYSSSQYATCEWGDISSHLMNVEQGELGHTPLADIIITSPPYANRLDYSSMWAPELETLAAMWGGDSRQVKINQIGSTVIKAKAVPTDEETNLPRTIIDALTAIREDKEWWASSRYYYPFFRNYAVTLSRSLKRISAQLKPGGTFIIFVRDTVRKDVMFPTSDLVRSILVEDCGMSELDRTRKIHRRHIGLLRKDSTVGLYGLAQQEWWLTFRKELT